MTEHMDLGSKPNLVERNPARYNQTIREAANHRFLADPVAFAQNMSRILETGILDDVLMRDVPVQIDDMRQEFEYLMDQAMTSREPAAIADVWVKYTEFMLYALGEAREYGVAMGAVMEQLRLGLVSVVDLSRRGLTFGDTQSFTELGKLRRKYGFRFSAEFDETDLSKIKEDNVA
jgi:hypothetical protein